MTSPKRPRWPREGRQREVQENMGMWPSNLSMTMSQAPQIPTGEEKETKKRGKRKAQVSTSLGEVKALLEELKEVKREAVKRKVFCSQCRVKGNLREECTTPSTCAICVMYNHTTGNYRYNMKNRAIAFVNQVEAQEPQATPQERLKGRGGCTGRMAEP